MTEAKSQGEQKRVQALQDLIAQEIQKNHGKIDFAQFMQLALYSPYGYYQAKPQILGAAGDYTTAPELTDLFSKCLADQCEQIFTTIQGDIVEFGAGTGRMAKSLMHALHEKECTPHTYYIIEISQHLRQLQQETIQSLPKQLRDKFVWVKEIPDNFVGVILANEVLDAMPVHRFRIDNHHLFEYNVIVDQCGHFQWHLQEITQGLLFDKCKQIKNRYLPDIPHYSSEYNLALQPFLQQVIKKINQAVFLIVDYGYHEREYYHAERTQGTLTCFYRQTHHNNPLLNVGNQDISAHVNYSQLAREARQVGFDILGYTHQAAFLLNCHLLEKIDENSPSHVKQHIQTLTLPTEMGELIKVIALAKDFSKDLLGFKSYNKRHYLLENL